MIELSLSVINRFGGTQPRAHLDDGIIQEYAEAMLAGDVFPPVTVFHDGADYWLADGFHRVNAGLRAGRETIDATIHQGTQRDAILWSISANATHGLRRTNEDKRRAVTRLLSDPEWAGWSNREIGRRAAVSDQLVNNLRAELSANGWQIEERRVTRNGTEYAMNTAAIGQATQTEHVGAQPAYSLQSVESAYAAALADPIVLTDDDRRAAVIGAISAAADPSWYQSSESDDWWTPQWLFDLLNSEFGFETDVCASDSNHKCAAYFTRQQDGLAQEWAGSCWMNPPYGRSGGSAPIGQWVEKAYSSALAGASVVCLVPARTDTSWWWKFCIRGEVRFLPGRLRFSESDNGATFPSAVVVFRPGVLPEAARVIWWQVQEVAR